MNKYNPFCFSVTYKLVNNSTFTFCSRMWQINAHVLNFYACPTVGIIHWHKITEPVSSSLNFDACQVVSLVHWQIKISSLVHMICLILLTIIQSYQPLKELSPIFSTFSQLLEILVSQESSYFSHNPCKISWLKSVAFGRY